MDYGWKMIRGHRPTMLCQFLLLWLLYAASLASTAVASEDADPGLQVVVLRGESDPDWVDGRPFKLRHLSNADLPLLISKSLVPFLPSDPLIRFSNFGLSGDIRFVDIHTLANACTESQFQWSNTISNLNVHVQGLVRTEEHYSLSSRTFRPGTYSLTLNGSFRRRPLEQMRVAGRIDGTTVAVQRLPDNTYIFFAFTWTDAIVKLKPLRPPKDAIIKKLERLSYTTPIYPGQFQRIGVESYFQVLVVIDTQGKVKPDRFLILDCTDPSFAESAMNSILNGWRFRPKSVDGKPVETVYHIQVRYKLLP